MEDINSTLSNDLFTVVLDWDAGFYTYRQPLNLLLIGLYILVFTASVLGNALVLVAVHSNRNIRSVTNYFLLNLAVADLLVALVCMPFTVGHLIYNLWIYGNFLCKATGYLQGVSIGASVLTIMLLSMDRYVAIKYPVQHRRIWSPGYVVGAILTVWAVSGAVMIPLGVARMTEAFPVIEGRMLNLCGEKWSSEKARWAFEIFLVIFIYVIPGAVVIFSYMSTGCRLMTEDKSLCRQHSSATSPQRHRLMAGRRRVARMLLLVAILFAVSWLPYHVVSLLHNFVSDWLTERSWNYVLSFALLLGHSHSAQNPILYCVLYRAFKVTITAILKCRRSELMVDISKMDSRYRNDLESRSASFRLQSTRQRRVRELGEGQGDSVTSSPVVDQATDSTVHRPLTDTGSAGTGCRVSYRSGQNESKCGILFQESFDSNRSLINCMNTDKWINGNVASDTKYSTNKSSIV